MIALGAALALWFLLAGTGLLDFSAEPNAEPARDDHGNFLVELERELVEQMTAGPGLQGMPGVEIRQHGHGVVRGTVVLHSAEGPPRPLPGLAVELLGAPAGGGDPPRFSQATDEEGVFTLPDLPARGGYVLLVDHPPYRRIVVKGVLVRKDENTDLGLLVLGAPTSLAGEIVDARGRPIAGALVQVLHDGGRGSSFDLRRALFELDGQLIPLADARGNVEGRFLLANMPPGRYVLRVSAPGHATRFKENVLVTVDEQSSAVRVVMDPGAGFEGRVSNEAGHGLAGGRVIAVAMQGGAMRRFDRVEVATAADGTYRIDTLVPGVKYAVEAWAPDHAPTVRYLESGSAVEKLDWTLLRSGRIEGRVLDEETGVGVEGAQVTALVGPLTGLSPVSTVTDETGSFALPHVNAGPVLLFSAHAPGYQGNDEINLASVRGLRVDAGETTYIEWRLHPGGAVEGRVSSDSGRAVAYASIALVDRDAGRRRWSGEMTAMSAADGTYRVVGVRPGHYDIRVSAPGYAPPTGANETHVEMVAGLGLVSKDLTLRRGGILEGTVTTPSGEALGGARIVIAPGDATTTVDMLRDLTAVSAGNGSFRIQGVPPETELLVEAQHDNWVAAAGVRARVGPGATRQLTLRLREGAKLPGRVVDRFGAGVSGARVRWGSIEGVPAHELQSSFQADAHLGARVLRTDNDGRFVVEGLAPGKLMLKVEQDGFAAWYRRDIQIGAEGDYPAMTIELESTLTVRGTVRSKATERPIGRAFVYARERGPAEGQPEDPGRVQAVVSTETDMDGNYVLDRLPAGTHEIVVWFAEGHVAAAQDWRSENVRRKDVVAGARGVDFVLDPLPLPGENR